MRVLETGNTFLKKNTQKKTRQSLRVAPLAFYRDAFSA